jgi:hypothetical protein
MRSLILLFLIIAIPLSLTRGLAAAADPPSGTFELKPIGAPLGTGKMVIEVTLVLGGQKVTKKVEIKEGDIQAFVMPARMQGPPKEPIADYAQRILNAQGEASNAKAKVVADAINEAFKNEFDKLPDKGASAKAGAGFTIVKNRNVEVREPGQAPIIVRGLEAPFGELVIPNVSKEKDKTGKEISGIKFLEGKILGEGGNAGGFRAPPPPGKPSPGARGSLERSTPGVITVATGIDPLGAPSKVEVGIDGIFVADYTPAAGDMDQNILSILASLLNSNGLPATFDLDLMELFLDMPLLDGQLFVWGNTDTGLEFLTSFEGLEEAAVPEPASAGLILIGLLALLATARWRLRTTCATSAASRAGSDLDDSRLQQIPF